MPDAFTEGPPKGELLDANGSAPPGGGVEALEELDDDDVVV